MIGDFLYACLFGLVVVVALGFFSYIAGFWFARGRLKAEGR